MRRGDLADLTAFVTPTSSASEPRHHASASHPQCLATRCVNWRNASGRGRRIRLQIAGSSGPAEFAFCPCGKLDHLGEQPLAIRPGLEPGPILGRVLLGQNAAQAGLLSARQPVPQSVAQHFYCAAVVLLVDAPGELSPQRVRAPRVSSGLRVSASALYCIQASTEDRSHALNHLHGAGRLCR
jgi:hypothetical protein